MTELERNAAYALIWALRPYENYDEVRREQRGLRSALLDDKKSRATAPSSAAAEHAPFEGI